MLIAAFVGYNVNSRGEIENASGLGLLLLVLSGMVFFAGWLLALRVYRERAQRKANQLSSGDKTQ